MNDYGRTARQINRYRRGSKGQPQGFPRAWSSCLRLGLALLEACLDLASISSRHMAAGAEARLCQSAGVQPTAHGPAAPNHLRITHAIYMQSRRAQIATTRVIFCDLACPALASPGWPWRALACPGLPLPSPACPPPPLACPGLPSYPAKMRLDHPFQPISSTPITVPICIGHCVDPIDRTQVYRNGRRRGSPRRSPWSFRTLAQSRVAVACRVATGFNSGSWRMDPEEKEKIQTEKKKVRKKEKKQVTPCFNNHLPEKLGFVGISVRTYAI